MKNQEIQSWREIGRERVLNRYMRVDRVEYELPNGASKDIYLDIRNPAACVVALTESNEVILVEQYRPGPDKVLRELPGGYIDDSEEPAAGIARELREETGYEGQVKFVTTCLDDAYSTMVRSIFVATGCRKVADQQLDDGEFIAVRLVPLDEFKGILRSGKMTDTEAGFLGLDFLKML